MRFHDHLNAINNSIKVFNSPAMRAINNSMKVLNSPAMQAINNSMKVFNSPAMQAINNSMKVFNSPAMQAINNSMKVFNSPAMRAINNSMKVLNSPALRTMSESLTELRENKFFSSVRENQENIRNIQGVLSGNNLTNLLKTVSNHGINFDVENSEQGLEFNLDGSISVSGSTISQNQIETAVNQVFNKVAESNYDRFDQAISSIHIEIQKLKDSPIKRFLSWLISLILTAVFASYINPLTENFLTNFSIKNKKEFVKKLDKTIVNDAGEKKELQRYRIVIADSLNVRTTNTKNSKKVGVLYFGQIVEVLRKKKNWTLVQSEDLQGESSIEGWVFSRYLKSFM